MRKKGLISALVILSVLFMAFKMENNKYFEITKNLEIFTNLYKELNTHYVDELDPGQLMKVGIEAIMQSLDPYTVYWSGTLIEGSRYKRTGSYKGMGATFQKIGDLITVTEIFKGFAAHEAGLQVGDQIHTVNEVNIVGKDLEEVEPFLLGTPGTSIRFGVKHPGALELESIDVLRSALTQSNVPHYQILDGDIAYVNLSTFTQLASKNIQGAIRKLKTQQRDLKGIILDLRNNGGGLLLEAVNVSNLFIPKGELVVSTKGKVPEWDRSYKTQLEPYNEEIPLVVLINKSSASASEIVAGVIQDLDRGVLIGQRSYGKGLVQNTKELGYNAKTKITTSKYYIPSNRCIQSIEYENGEPKDIPDDLRATFYTRAGRPVKDGGGISPDLEIVRKPESEFQKALKEKHVIFNFATQYLLDNEVIIDSSGYRFTDFALFDQYLKDRSFSYKTEAQETLENLREKAKNGPMSAQFDATINELINEIKENNENALSEEKEEVFSLIEEELIGRKHFEKGKITYHLNRDPEVIKAIEILNDPSTYKSLLSKQ